MIKQLKVLDKLELSSKNSTKKVFHIALESDYPYQPGDILKIYPTNHPDLEDQMKKIYKRDLDEDFKYLDLRIPSDILLKRVSEKSNEIKELLLPMNFIKKRAFTMNNTVPEILNRFISINEIDYENIKKLLLHIRPRSYSISSSRKKYPNEVHIMLSLSNFKSEKGIETGTASGYLIDRVKIGDRIMSEYKENMNFRLPEEDRDLIMIGPGTGLAPFIGFLQEREDSKAKKWLLFGERNRDSNFYYEDYLSSLASKNQLELDLAFSRDIPSQYVQDVLKKKKEHLKSFLKDAHIYICGDRRMGRSVEETLKSIISTDPNEARQKLAGLKKEGRYKLDLY